MKQRNVRASAALAGAAMAAAAFCNSAHGTVVINEIYGEGGYNSTSVYLNDFVELYNNGTTAVNVGGYSLEYGGYSAALDPATYDIVTLASVSVAPGGYFLLDLPAASTSTSHQFGTPLSSAIAVDQLDTVYANTFVPSYLGGKLGLFDASGNIQDYVGYGDDTAVGTAPAGASGTAFTLPNNANAGTGVAASFSVGTVTATAFTDTNALTRTVAGVDTGNNFVDFSDGTPTLNSTASSSVPEPTTVGLLAAGGSLLVARRRNRKDSTK